MRIKTLIAATLISLPLGAAAQSLELTPMIGYRWGGTLTAESNDLFNQDMDVDSAASYALLVDVPLGRHHQIELFVDHQSTQFGNDVLFAPPSPDRIDTDITYYHVGYVFQWTPGNLRPYVTASLGLASIDPDVPGIGREERFSWSMGGGLKVLASEHVGFRLDTRIFGADTGSFSNDWGDDHCHWDDDDCYDWSNDLYQVEVKVGVVFSF